MWVLVCVCACVRSFLFFEIHILLFFVFLIIDLCPSIGCRHFCLYARSATNYACTCHIGYSLQPDSKSCRKLVADAAIVSVYAPNQLKFEDITSGMITNVEIYDMSELSSIYNGINKFDIRNIAICGDKLSFIEKKDKTVWHCFNSFVPQSQLNKATYTLGKNTLTNLNLKPRAGRDIRKSSLTGLAYPRRNCTQGLLA